MTGIVYALVGLLVITTGGLVTFALFDRKSNRELLAARDRIAKQDEAFNEMERDRDGLRVELAAARDLATKERDLRAVAETQRNEAYREARTDVIERIKKAGVADAQRIVADLLAAPLGVSQAVPAKRSEDPRDGLLDPFAVQPAGDP